MRGIEDTSVLGVGLQSGVGQLGVGYLGVRGESLDTDQLSLDLQFATDKTLVARKGPTPVFTRSSGDNRGTTYFGPSSINAIFTFDGTGFNVNMSQSTLFNGRYRWENGDTLLSYNGTAWSLSQDGNAVATSALTSAFRPDGADWSGTAAVVTATSTLGIVRAANNEPRFDHDPVALACKGLLIEESRTNLLQRSDDFNNAYWTKTNSSILSDFTTSPSGSVDADKIVEDTSAGAHGVSVNPTITSGIAYTLSFYAKKGERSWIRATVTSSGISTWFDLDSGVIGTVGSGVTASIQSVGGGWYRCVATMTSASTSGNINIRSQTADGQTTFTGDGTSGLFLYGAQLEAGSFPTSYIPTTTASVIRSADVCSITGSAFSGFYNPLEGSFAVSLIFNAPNISSQGQIVFDVNDTTSNNRVRVFRYNNTSLIGFNNTIGGSNDALITGSTTIITGSVVKLANCIKSNDFAIYLNGVLQGTDTSVTLASTLTTLTIGEVASGVVGKLPLNGTIDYLRYYKKRLPASKLQAFTV